MLKIKSVQQRRDYDRRGKGDDHRRQRAALKAQSVNLLLSPEERLQAKQALTQRDRNTSATRVVNRCVETGRGRSVMRFFRRSRYVIRDRMLNAELAK